MNILNSYSGTQLPILITTCAGKDMNTWKVAAAKIIKYISCDEYIVVVPEQDFKLFKRFTPSKFEIVSESEFCPSLKDRLIKSLPTKYRNRIGWYLQQIIKLKLLETYQNREYIIIWDADTIPTKKLNFFENSKVNIYLGKEYNKEYFVTNEYLTGIGKIAPFSFIAQCMACKGIWAQEFFASIEQNHKQKWDNVMYTLMEKSTISSFSEYEALGSFMYANHKDDLNLLQNHRWLRHGKGYFGNAALFRILMLIIRMNNDFVSFESWDPPFSRYKIKSKEYIKKKLTMNH